MRFEEPTLAAMINTAFKGENQYFVSGKLIGGKTVDQLIHS